MTAAVAYLWRKATQTEKDLDEHKTSVIKDLHEHKEKVARDIEAQKSDLAATKLDNEKRFAKEETMQMSLSRLHDRLDEVGRDIKTLVQRK